MPTIITDGAASAQGYGFAAKSAAANYIEDVFSTYLYTGNNSTQTITNGIDLSTKGGLVWSKSRASSIDHALYDTARGNKFLSSNTTNAQSNPSISGMSFTTTGYNLLGADGNLNNTSFSPYVSWTFRKQAKFFDVVTYTGNGINGTAISHNLGSVPGCIIIKRTDTTGDWYVYHRSYNGGVNPEQYTTYLNLTNAVAGPGSFSQYQAPTSTAFYPGGAVNAVGGSAKYVAYLFAHDAGGFGAAGSDNVISCGSYTGDGTDGQFVNVGFEVQWLLVKRTNAVGDWFLVDVMRGALANGAYPCANLYPNLSNAETLAGTFGPDPRGFRISASTSTNASGSPFIYIAIRRGPMKTPTTGTSVFGLSARTGTGANATVTGGQTDDAILVKNRGRVQASLFSSRLTGTGYLSTSSTAAEAAAGTTILQASPWDVMDGVKLGTTSYFTNATADTFINYLFRRAPGFFDVVCYTGTGASATLNHNLGVAPNMVIIKGRSVVSNWETYLSSLGGTGGNGLAINDSGAKSGTPPVSSATATTFTLNNGVSTSSGQTYVAYLFATLTGVSKVGSYTGTGTTKQIDCGFTGGARFVLIKRTDSTGDWYVWDSARGIVAGNDPYLLLNSTAAEVTGTDYVDTYSAGFEISSTAPAAINANGGSYIFMAVS